MASGDRFPSPLRLAIGVGLLLSGTTMLFYLSLAGFELDAFGSIGLEEMYILGGTFFLGAIPTYVSARYQVFIPVLTTVIPYFLLLVMDAERIIEQSNRDLLTTTGFELFIVYWPVILLVALLLGSSEHDLRKLITGSSWWRANRE